MHTVFALLCFVVVRHWLIFPYPSGLLHWHCGNLTIAPVPAKQPWWIWINTSCESIMNDCITTTKQSTTKPCAYFLGYTVKAWCRTGDKLCLNLWSQISIIPYWITKRRWADRILLHLIWKPHVLMWYGMSATRRVVLISQPLWWSQSKSDTTATQFLHGVIRNSLGNRFTSEFWLTYVRHINFAYISMVLIT